jgi:hypothetical protein
MGRATEADQLVLEVLGEHPARDQIAEVMRSKVHFLNGEIDHISRCGLTHSERWTLLERSDYGRTGGSHADRRLFVEGLALLEQAGKLRRWRAPLE